MDIEEEFLDFLINVPRTVGQPRMDGTPRKMADLDPALLSRNQAIILEYYGFGGEDEFLPTYDELGRKHGGLTRERIRQLIQRNYLDQIDGPLPVATEIAKVLSQRDFWEEQDFLEQLRVRRLASHFPHVIGIMQYLKSQNLAEDYVVCLPTLKEVTRNSYSDHEVRVIVSKDKIKTLEKHLDAAQKVPGQAGLANIRYASSPKSPVDIEALKTLIRSNANAWTAMDRDKFWYMFEDRADNTLINAAEKISTIADRLPLDAVSEMLHHALYRRSTRTEFPSEDLIRTWITQSRHFSVEEGLVNFKVGPVPLADSEQTLVDIMRGKGSMPTSSVTEALLAKGLNVATSNKLVFNSPLVFVDRSGGRRHFRVTLATDLGAAVNTSVDSRYSRFKKRLAGIGKTDRESAVTLRREQWILAEWIFGDQKQGECAICQKMYSRSALVVAHKKKRSRCADNERLDPHIVFPLCIFGCDFLYEGGFLKIRNGQVEQGIIALSETEKNAAAALLGKKLKLPWAEGPPEYFANG